MGVSLPDSLLLRWKFSIIKARTAKYNKVVSNPAADWKGRDGLAFWGQFPLTWVTLWLRREEQAGLV